MSDTIHLKGMRFFSHVGFFTEEKKNGQWFELDVDLFFHRPLTATTTDNLHESISYADVYDTVKTIVEPASYDLIEKLAGRVADVILATYWCNSVKVTVKKPDAPIDGSFQYMGVSITRTRQHAQHAVYRVLLGLGSNLGDRRTTLMNALIMLEKTEAVSLRSVSSLYETAPWGGIEQPAFLNAVCLLETTLDPFALLNRLQAIEIAHGRTREVRWGARTLDLDILEIDDVTIASPLLTVPHPHMQERYFVLIPRAEVLGLTIPKSMDVTLVERNWYCPPPALPLE